MNRNIETKKAAQQTFSNLAINRLNESIHAFHSIRNIDASQSKGRLVYAEQLMAVEDQLLTVKNQVHALRLLYGEE